MTAYELYQQAQLDEAIEAAIREVKAKPADVDKRLFLCDLLCLAGQLERADRQLNTLMQQDPELAVGISLYRQLIRAEKARCEFAESGRVPEFMEDVGDSLKLHLRAAIAVREGDLAEARRLLDEADELRTPLTGQCDGEPFDDFRDLDDLMATLLEVLTSTGKYYWVPWERIESIEFPAARQLRDLVWRPAQMSIRNGPEAVVYVPAIYTGSHSSDDARLRAGQSTDWIETDGGPTRGVGQRMFLIGDEDKSILAIGKITFDAPASRSDSAGR